MTDRSPTPAQVAVKPEWHCDDMAPLGGVLFYTLRPHRQIGGKTIMTNDVTVRVEAAPNSKTDLEPTIEAIRSALTSAPAPAEQEPVAWRVRVKSDDPEEWSLLPAGGGADYLDRKGYECQPLYTHPAPAPAVPDDVAGRNGVYGNVILHGDARVVADGLQATIEAQAAELAWLKQRLDKAEDAYDREIARPGRFPDCECNDDDCEACCHYPALVHDAKKRIAARAALSSQPDGEGAT